MPSSWEAWPRMTRAIDMSRLDYVVVVEYGTPYLEDP